MSTYTEFYCDPVNGSNLNAGSTPTTPVYNGVGDSDGTSVFTPSDGSTPANTISNGMWASIYVTAGATVTVFVGRITNVAAGVNGAITVSTTAKAGTIPANSAGAHTISCIVGGPFKGPNGATAFPFGFAVGTMTDAAGDFPRVNFLVGTYSITAAMTQNGAGPVAFQGYTSSPGDLGRATIDGGTSGVSYVLLTVSGAQNFLRDLIFQNNGASGSAAGVTASTTRVTWERVTVNSVRGNGFANSGGGGQYLECEAYSCNQSNTTLTGGFASAANGNTYERCLSHDNSGSANVGFQTANTAFYINCIADTNGLTGFQITGGNSSSVLLERCTAYGNGGAGVLASANNCELIAENCILANNTTFGVNSSGTNNYARLINCGFFSNTSGQTGGVVDATGTITFSSQPMTDPANGDFSVLITAAMNVGRGSFTQNPGIYTKTTTSYPDVGAVQHRDARTIIRLMGAVQRNTSQQGGVQRNSRVQGDIQRNVGLTANAGASS